jgi:hypothetical protein
MHHAVSYPKKADGYIGYKDGISVELIAVPLSNTLIFLYLGP